MISVSTPGTYFLESIRCAADKQGKKLDTQIEYYLVQLLCRFVGIESIKRPDEEINLFNTPLVFIFKKAREAPTEQQVKLYKYLGDSSLFFAGYFKKYLDRRLIDRGYCVTMGATAYDTLSQIMHSRHHDPDFAALYNMLSTQFSDLVALLDSMALQNDEPLSGFVLAGCA